MINTTNTNSIQLYDLLQPKLGNKPTEHLIKYVDTKVETTLEQKLASLATKDDVYALRLKTETIRIELKDEINALRVETKEEIAALKSEFKDFRIELKDEINALRVETKGEIAALKSEFDNLRIEMKDFKIEMLKAFQELSDKITQRIDRHFIWMIGIMVSQTALYTGLVYFLIKMATR